MVKFLTDIRIIIPLTLLVFFGCLLYYYIDPSLSPFMPKCIFKSLTGFDCPGCGLQRALHALLHGKFSEAIRFNFFLIIAIPMICLWLVNSFIIEHTHLVNNNVKNRLRSANQYIVKLYILCYFLWFVIRNIN